MGYAMAAEAPGGAEVIRRIEIGEITPAAGEVVIEHEAIGVNFIDIYLSLIHILTLPTITGV